MRIMAVAPPPWVLTSGYGLQCHYMTSCWIDLGHEVAVLAYAGVHERQSWNGIEILPNGGAPFANGTIPGWAARWRADVTVMLTDPWVIDPAQLTGVVMPWFPLDTDELGAMCSRWLEVAGSACDLHPVAMSDHGRNLLADAEFDAPVVPLATDLRPDPEAGIRWRKARKVPDGAFLVVKVGVNNEDDRKAFGVTLQALAEVKRTLAYLHCDPQANKAPNLVVMAAGLGLQGRVIFPDPWERQCDQHDQAYISGMYNAADVLDIATKGEGFGVPAIEALACGTPVIGCRNSAMTEKIRPEWGWLVNGQRTWARHHRSWWTEPSVRELARAYEQARTSARSKRTAAAREGARWSVAAMRDAWEKALAGL